MSLDPPGIDAAEDDSLLVDGLERALAKARTKIADHDRDHHDDIELSSVGNSLDGSSVKVAAMPAVDTSAVMEVLRGAIDRYTNGDGHEQGVWDDDHPLAATSATPVSTGARHLAAGYHPDRRRLAAAVVVLFLVIAGFGYQRFGTSSGGKVKTETTPSVQGRAVTTLARPTTASTVPLETAPPDTEAPVVASPTSPATTVRRSATTAPPSTDPPVTDPPTTEPPTTAPTTTEAPTTTTEAPTTTTECPTPPVCT